MNHGNFNNFDDWNSYFLQFSDSYLSPASEQEFLDDQLDLAATSSEILIRPDILQHEVMSTEVGYNNTMIESSGISGNVPGLDPARLERKRKSDREYRQRCKESRKKAEEELKFLRKENALLEGRLQSANSKQMLKSDAEKNDSDQLCKIEFRLECCNNKLRGEAMKVVGEFPGLKRFSLNVEEKKLTLYGKDIDTLNLQIKLKKVCNASLVSFSIVSKKDEEKKEGKIVMDMVVARTSTLVPQNSYGGSSEGCLRISEAAFISFTSLAPARCCGLF